MQTNQDKPRKKFFVRRSHTTSHTLIVIKYNSGRSPRRFFGSAMAKGARSALVVTLATLAIVGFAYAGSLTPSASPAATMHSLADIAGSGFATATHSLKALFAAIGGTYDSTSITANADGNLMERLQFLQQNLPGGFSFGSSDADKVLASAGGTYDATNLTPANVKLNLAFGTGNGSQTGTFSGSGNFVYGDDDPSKVLTTATSTGTWDASNLLASVVKLSTTFATSSTGSLTPDGGTASITDLFTGKTVHLSADWTLDTGTLDIACNTSTFDGTANLVATAYDGTGDGTNRWCVTDSGDAVAGDITSGKIAWVDGVAVTGTVANVGLHTGQTTSYRTGDDASNDATAKSYTDNADGTVTDNQTALIWQKDDQATQIWNSAIDYCDGLTLASSSAWRLPTSIEGITMFDYACGGAGGSCFADFQNTALTWDDTGSTGFMWLSTTLSDSTSVAYYLDMSVGLVVNSAKTNSLFVRCVRSV